MGAWGLEAFDSDGALDLVYDMETPKDIHEMIENYDQILEKAWMEEEAFVHMLGEIIAAANHKPKGVYQSESTGLLDKIMVGKENEHLVTEALGGTVYVPEEIMAMINDGSLVFTQEEVDKIKDRLMIISADKEAFEASGWNEPEKRREALLRTLSRMP